jgi:DNA-binding NarL/FixJ family response regulator
VRLLLVDPAPIFRTGLKIALAEAPGGSEMNVVGECADGASAVQAAAALAPDIVISELSLGDCNAVVLAHRLRRSMPSARLLILTSHGAEVIVHAALGAGASGYVLKTDEPLQVVAAIRKVAAGGLVVPPGIPEPSRSAARPNGVPTRGGIDRLSFREAEVFDLVIWGSSNKQIAGRLGISVKTVETHRGHINRKLRVHKSADIVRLASFLGMLAPMSVSRSTAPSPLET